MNLQELKEKALKMKNDAQEKLIEIKNKAISMKDGAGDKVNQAKEKTEELKENANSLKKEATSKANNIKEKVENTKDKATNKVSEIKEQALNAKIKANDSIKKVKEDVDVVKSKVTDKKNEIKSKSEEIKNDVTQKKDEVINKGKQGFFSIKFGVNTKEELDFIIKKSATTSITNPETGEEKSYRHKSMVIFAEQGSEFMKKAYYIVPVIVTKAFSQNIAVKLANSKIEGVDLKKFAVEENNLPCIAIFEEEKYLKTISGEENILKLVKSLDLDINKLIEEA
ncbi:MAG: hypothetical protein PHS49_05175 [Candidatus Gracilibacteria bacterium]|nr:hypothetical protein [Candidatus Gracilibacteria bacterium]